MNNNFLKKIKRVANFWLTALVRSSRAEPSKTKKASRNIVKP
jgi:hypothetical protein